MAHMDLAGGKSVWTPRMGWLPKVVAVDEDGTFLQAHATYDVERFESLWPRLQAAGTRFVVATGNQYWQARDIFQAHADEIGYVTANGAMVADIGGERVQVVAANERAVQAILADARAYPEVSFLLAGEHGAYVGRDAPDEFVGDFARYYHRLSRVDDLSRVSDRALMLSTVVPEAEAERWRARFDELGGGSLVPVYSGEGYFDLMVPGISKATGLAALCDRWGVAAADVAAFGDGENDMAMIGWAGAGYAMGNASERVKSAAGGVAPPNEEDGVLQVLEAWFGA